MSVYAGGGGSRLQLLGLGKLWVGKLRPKTKALLRHFFQLSGDCKKKKEMQRKIRQYLEAQIFRVYQIPTAVTNGNAWKYGFQTIFDYVGCIFSYLRSAQDKQGGSAMTLKVDLGKCARVCVANK